MFLPSINEGSPGGVKELLRGALDLFFPPRCLYCDTDLQINEKKDHLCSPCLTDIDPIKSPLCRCCGVSFVSETATDHLCGKCLTTPPPFQAARSVVLYTSVVKYLLHRLKYASDTTVLPAIGSIISQTDMLHFSDVDLVVPVPLHKNRLRQRGLNQSHLLARLFFPEDLRQIQPQHLIRYKDTIPQTTLNGAKRRKNLRGAFRVPDPAHILGRSICLVDDVLTTGTTVTECSKTLIRAGAKEVKVLTFARADRGE